MKKILVVLLVLFVAGGVFAQEGEWSLMGQVEVGTRLDFDPDPDVDAKDDKATVDGIAFWNYGKPSGNVSIGYTRGAANIGIMIDSFGDSVFDVNFSGENFKAQLKFKDLIGALSGNGGTKTHGDIGPWVADGSQKSVLDRLWGEYKFFNGVITLLAAASSPDAEYWASDITGTFYGTMLAGFPVNNSSVGLTLTPDGLGSDDILYSGWKTKMMFGDGQYTFTAVDHNNYLLVGADISALSFGIMIPNLFIPMAGGAWDSWGGPSREFELLAHALPYTVLGVKFAQAPLEFAAQFQMANYGIYFGGRFFAGPITVGLSFTGVLDKYRDDPSADVKYDPKQVKFGGRVDYDGGMFGGGIKGFYSRDEQDQQGDTYLSVVGVEPVFFYNAIPSHLRFDVNVGFYFFNYTDTAADTSEKTTVWAVQPQIFWNFLGTGAGTYYSFGTGIMVRYRLAVADTRNISLLNANDGANFLDVIFKLSF